MSRSTGKKNHSKIRNKATIIFDSKAFNQVFGRFSISQADIQVLTNGYIDVSRDNGETWYRFGTIPIKLKGYYGESPLQTFRRERGGEINANQSKAAIQ